MMADFVLRTKIDVHVYLELYTVILVQVNGALVPISKEGIYLYVASYDADPPLSIPNVQVR